MRKVPELLYGNYFDTSSYEKFKGTLVLLLPAIYMSCIRQGSRVSAKP